MAQQRRVRIIIITLLVSCALLLITTKAMLGDFSAVVALFAPNMTASPTPTLDTAQLPTATPTSTSTPEPTPTFADAHANCYDAETMDFSFLNDISHAFFEDAEDDGSWFPGKAVRDTETGEVDYVWERYDSTLETLAKYGAIYRKNANKHVVYLTFDVGYENGYTQDILDTLKRKDVKAIFFVTGSYIDENPEIIKKINDDGHLIGNHTNSHVNMSTQSNVEFVRQLIDVELKLKAILGNDFQTIYYRPPEGIATEYDLAIAKHIGYTTVFWSFAYGDYDENDQPTFDAALKRTQERLHDGAVYLLHSTSQTNSKILPYLIDYMREQGFDIRRLDE